MKFRAAWLLRSKRRASDGLTLTTAVPVDETSLSSEPIIDVVAARHLHCSPRGPGRQSLNPRRRRQSSEWTPARYVTVMSRYRGFTPSCVLSLLLLPSCVFKSRQDNLVYITIIQRMVYANFPTSCDTESSFLLLLLLSLFVLLPVCQ